MNWYICLLLIVICLLPTIFVLIQDASKPLSALPADDSSQKAITLYSSQLSEIDSLLKDGQITPAEHKNSQLEIQRRILHHHSIKEPHKELSNKTKKYSYIVASTIIGFIFMGSFILYLTNGYPSLPAYPLKQHVKEQYLEFAKIDQQIADLKEKISHIPAGKTEAFPLLATLGQIQIKAGYFKDARDTLEKALALHFDPLLAAITAEASTQAAGFITPRANELYKKALKEAPPNAPWKLQVQQRISESEHRP